MKLPTIITLAAVALMAGCAAQATPTERIVVDMIEAPVEPTGTTAPPGNDDPTTTTIAEPVDCSMSNSDECRPTCDVDPVNCLPGPATTVTIPPCDPPSNGEPCPVNDD